MKYLIIILFMLVGCTKLEKKYFYVNTIAISYDESGYNMTIMKYSDNELKTANTTSNSIEEAFNELDSSIEIALALNYLSNVVIEYDSLEIVIPKFIDWISKNENVSLNFYVYTVDDCEKIKEVKAVDSKSNVSFHISPRRCTNLIHTKYLDFVINYKDKNLIYLPLIEFSNNYEETTMYSNKMIEIKI